MTKKLMDHYHRTHQVVELLTHRLHLVEFFLVFDGHVVKLFFFLIKLQLKLAVLLLLLPQIRRTALLLLVELHIFTIHDLCQFVHRLTTGGRWNKGKESITAITQLND